MHNDFDNSAKSYDVAFTHSEIGKAQRNRVHHFISEKILSTKKLNILEVNCGTGEDALFFTNNGHKVLATDISESMVELAKKKNKSESARFIQQDINAITTETFSEKFDLIFSNFGGLNCLSLDQLWSFLTISETLLNSNGELSLVIMPKECLWERFYFSIKGSFKKARRRKSSNPIVANVDGTDVMTWYYNPKEIIPLVEEKFHVRSIKPIGITIPPSYLESFFSRKKLLLQILVKIENWFSSKFWAKYADHYLIVFQKK